MAEEKKTYKFVCTVCGYEVEVDTRGLRVPGLWRRPR